MNLRSPLSALAATRRRPRLRPALVVLIVLALLLPAWEFAAVSHHRSLLEERRAHVADTLTPYSNTLFTELVEHLGLLSGLATTLSLQPAAGDTWSAEASAILTSTEGARGLAVAPSGVVAYAYPALPAGLSLGEDLLAPGASRFHADALLAVSTRATTLSSLYDEPTGTIELVAWRAVHTGDEFWGLVGMELLSAHFLQALTPGADSQPLEIAWRDARGSIIYGSAAVFDSSPVLRVLNLPSGSWEVAALPAGGWEQALAEPMLTFRLYGLLFVGLLLCIAYLLASREAKLVATVDERTAEVIQVNQALQADVARRVAAEAERERLLAHLGEQVAERTHHLAALYDVTAVAGSSLELRTILDESLQRILEVMSCEVAIVHLDQSGDRQRYTHVATTGADDTSGLLTKPCPLAGGEGQDCWVVNHNQALRVDDTAADARTQQAFTHLGSRAHLGAPIRGRAGSLGVICVFRSTARPFSEEELALLAAIADRLGVAVENARLFAEASGKAILEERQRLARELHDSVTQLLYSAVLMAEATRRVAASGDTERVQQYVERLGGSVQQALKEMRLLVYELRPLSLEQDGLVGALQRRLDAVEKRAGLRATLAADGLPALAPEAEEALYRIAEEALNNTLKHGEAPEVTVSLTASAEAVWLRVADNGRGLPENGSTDRGGQGLANMRARAERLGGSFVIHSQPGQGTVVEARLPREEMLAEVAEVAG